MSNGKLDSPNLDDRTWQDIVDEAKALIPIYASEWTDHNPSDLGITLIELFAWIVEGMIYRLNRVPEKNFIEFLNLLGITRDPAIPASTILTYCLASGASPTIVPKGSQAATQQTEKEEGIVFETDEELKVLPANLTTALLIREKVNIYEDVTYNLVKSPFSKLTLSISGSESNIILLGFDSPSTEAISLLFGFDKPVKKNGVPIEITWLYSKGTNEPLLTKNEKSWPEIVPAADGNVSDETNIFQKNGRVTLKVPGDWSSQKPIWSSIYPNPVIDVNQSLYWIGIRIRNPRTDNLEIDLQHILFNSVYATNAITITQPELLGVSSGKSCQFFELKNRPLFKRPGARNPYDHLVIQVREPKIGGLNGEFEPWKTWTLCDNFEKGSGSYFGMNPVTGTINFGDYDPATSSEGNGTIPPNGSEIRVQTYRYVVGGVKSNVPSNTVNSMRTYIPGVKSVKNLRAAKGGFDEEDIEKTKQRGPGILRNRYRAVTLEDYEYLAKEVTPAVKKVRCLAPRLFSNYDYLEGVNIDEPWTFGGLNRSTGNINVIIIPDSPNDPVPMPSEDLLQEVSDYLNERRTLTTKLHVTFPRYLPITVNADIKVWQKAVDDRLIPNPADSDELKTEINDKIKEFLHPVSGGPDGNGWEVGQDITISALFDYIKPSSDIGFISNLSVQALNPLYSPTVRPFPSMKNPSVWVRLADYEIICSGESHNVKVEMLKV
jgi:hypothetical protein